MQNAEEALACQLEIPAVSRSIQSAQPPLKFIPPSYSPRITAIVQRLVPTLMRQKTGLQQVKADNLEQLVKLYQEFEQGKIRLILAFRHPSVNDPWALGYTFSQLVPKTAGQMGVKLRQPVHAHFMYDRGVPLWAGDFMGWIFAKLGGTSILRGKLDRSGLKSARDLLSQGKLPFLAAPEGATNGHNEIVAPLEPGLAQLAFWCAEDLAKAQRSERVVIVPIGIQYHYSDQPWADIEALLTDLETRVGIASHQVGDLNQAVLYQRLTMLGQRLLTMMEQHYSRFYHCEIPPVNAELEPSQQFKQRLHNLLNTCLTVSEAFFDVQPKGSMIDRCRRLEQSAWDNIYREDVDLATLSPVERQLADRVATESQQYLWHMRLVESFVSVTGHYVREKPSVERFAETLLITWETIVRIEGDRNSMHRPKLGDQAALVTIGQPISVSDRFTQYQTNRRAAKQAVEDLTQDLQTALERMIVH
jgi:1-acyl-sn-glycerol-3-phosphate acyltransferase